MTRLAAYGIGMCLALSHFFMAIPDASAQRVPAKPSKRSFSNQKPAPATALKNPGQRQPSQEELADAVLADTLNRLWNQADAHFHEGEYNHVINLNRIIVQGDPHNTEAFSTSAWLYWSTGRNDEAAALLTQGIAVNTDRYDLYNEMGNFWNLQRKDWKGATPFYEQAVKFECPSRVWHSLANCYEKGGLWDKAVGAWEKASAYPNDAVALVRLKRARARLAQTSHGQ